jgi:NAD(P)-dependent dehydrogenase (short-subunit alcohol dehydrogenase family)
MLGKGKMAQQADFIDKVVVVTGGAQGIGRCISEEFRKAGAQVCLIDKQEGDHFVGDIADKQTLEQFAQEVITKHGHVYPLWPCPEGREAREEIADIIRNS